MCGVDGARAFGSYLALELTWRPGRVAIESLQAAYPAVAGLVASAAAAAAAATPSAPREARLIHAGSMALPPLVEVPGGPLPLAAVVKPPDADTLWQWQSSRGMTDADSSWASVWPAAASLAAYVAASPELVRGRTVAELGSGLGVTGLTAATVGAARVVLIDREPLALHCALSTATLCGLEVGAVPEASAEGAADGAAAPAEGATGVVSASMADWAALSESLTFDVVLAAEVLYDPEEAAPLARSAAALLRDGGTLLLADPLRGRAAGCREAATQALQALGARVTLTPLGNAEGGGDSSEELVLLRADF